MANKCIGLFYPPTKLKFIIGLTGYSIDYSEMHALPIASAKKIYNLSIGSVIFNGAFNMFIKIIMSGRR